MSRYHKNCNHWIMVISNNTAVCKKCCRAAYHLIMLPSNNICNATLLGSLYCLVTLTVSCNIQRGSYIVKQRRHLTFAFHISREKTASWWPRTACINALIQILYPGPNIQTFKESWLLLTRGVDKFARVRGLGDGCQSCNRNIANKGFAINRHSPRSIAWTLRLHQLTSRFCWCTVEPLLKDSPN